MSFDCLARAYYPLEVLTFGRLLWRRRTHFLAEFSRVQNALVIGDGDGRFTAELLRIAPGVTINSIDSSAAMLEESKRRVAAIGLTAQDRIRHIKADIRSHPLASPESKPWDGVVTHFSLDCLWQQEVETLAANLASHVQEGTLWLISEFSLPERQPFRLLGRAVIHGLYFIFGLLTGLQVNVLPDHCSALGNAGFHLHRLDTSSWGLLRSEIWIFKGRGSDGASGEDPPLPVENTSTGEPILPYGYLQSP